MMDLTGRGIFALLWLGAGMEALVLGHWLSGAAILLSLVAVALWPVKP